MRLVVSSIHISQDRLRNRGESGRVSFFRSVARSIRLTGYFLQFGAELLVRRPSTREARAEWLHRFAAAALHGLGVEIELTGSFPERRCHLESPQLSRYHRLCRASSLRLRLEGRGRRLSRSGVDDDNVGHRVCRARTRRFGAEGARGCGGGSQRRSSGGLLSRRHDQQRQWIVEVPQRTAVAGASHGCSGDRGTYLLSPWRGKRQRDRLRRCLLLGR